MSPAWFRSAGAARCTRKALASVRNVRVNRRQVTTASKDAPVPPYERLIATLETVKAMLGKRRLTLAEKILYSHIHNPSTGGAPIKGASYLKLSPDRVAMQDASAQMAILQFMLAGRNTTAVPTSIHCDHLIEAFEGGDKDVERSLITNKEIFDFLQAAATKYGIDFWKPGSGIIHQIVLENYAAPGLLMLGTDSHTPNAGGLGMLAIGVGGADAVDAMAGIPWELKAPKVLGIRLDGKLGGWTSPKDVILHLAGRLTVQGGTNHIIEYFGPGTETLSCTGMATICNMGAEVGATTSTFPYSRNMAQYLRATGRDHIADAADKAATAGFLRADAEAEYDNVIEVDLATLEPHINGPFTPDAATPLSKFKELVERNGWKDEVKAGLIGSCTNSSYEDMSRAASLARQALENGLRTKSPFFITPGSEQIRATVERDGQTQALSEAGGQVLANACGPCIGQWKRTDQEKNEENAILTSFNRNFRARNDGHSKTMNFLASPEIVTAMTFAGRLTFNPATDSLMDVNGRPFRFVPPEGDQLPKAGFTAGRLAYKPPGLPEPNPSVSVVVDPASKRLQVLEPFDPWNGAEFVDMRVLVKVRGKCTTDHISAAGPWLKYKGHLENIANNTLIGATNAFNGQVNSVRNFITGSEDTIPNVARHYKAEGIPWVVVADSNYGEGSAREHAALQPRYLGCRAIVSRSFARIHETNLKKQGILPLTFADPADYDRIPENATISTRGLVDITPGSQVVLIVSPASGAPFEVNVCHTMSADQIEWFKAGSALNMIAAAQTSPSAASS
ncbi:aconitate hydratase [Gaertneriomyces sp. JEL0708]|nr:aconitate hydratase [Gaertneriomyces sp. JEL0708]